MASIGKGVEGIRVWDESGSFRVIHTARLAGAVYVLHAFQKKAQATSKRDIYTAQARFAQLKKGELRKRKIASYTSVRDAQADTPEEAANPRLRSGLMGKITALVDENRWAQADAARCFGVTQARMNDLRRGRISRFSLGALTNIAAALGRRVHIELEAV